jgi:transcriptional regulator with XRE-family HTH domain
VGQVAAGIRQRREHLKLDVSEVAAAASASAQGWYHWEQGTHMPPLAKLPAIAAALKCTPRDLIPDDC